MLYLCTTASRDDLGDQANMVREQMLDMAPERVGQNLDREAFKGIDLAGRVDGSADSASAYLSGGGGIARQAASPSLHRPSLKAQEQAGSVASHLHRQLASVTHLRPDLGAGRALMSQASAAYERVT